MWSLHQEHLFLLQCLLCRFSAQLLALLEQSRTGLWAVPSRMKENNVVFSPWVRSPSAAGSGRPPADSCWACTTDSQAGSTSQRTGHSYRRNPSKIHRNQHIPTKCFDFYMWSVFPSENPLEGFQSFFFFSPVRFPSRSEVKVIII